jgi:hypothetical protein
VKGSPILFPIGFAEQGQDLNKSLTLSSLTKGSVTRLFLTPALSITLQQEAFSPFVG